MTINKNAVIGILAAVALYNEVAAVVNGRRCNRNAKLLEQTRDRLEDAHHVLNYYATKLDNAGIPMEPFDEIVVKSLYT